MFLHDDFRKPDLLVFWGLSFCTTRWPCELILRACGEEVMRWQFLFGWTHVKQWSILCPNFSIEGFPTLSRTWSSSFSQCQRKFFICSFSLVSPANEAILKALLPHVLSLCYAKVAMKTETTCTWCLWPDHLSQLLKSDSSQSIILAAEELKIQWEDCWKLSYWEQSHEF